MEYGLMGEKASLFKKLVFFPFKEWKQKVLSAKYISMTSWLKFLVSFNLYIKSPPHDK